jgi:hypothetical protein
MMRLFFVILFHIPVILKSQDTSSLIKIEKIKALKQNKDFEIKQSDYSFSLENFEENCCKLKINQYAPHPNKIKVEGYFELRNNMRDSLSICGIMGLNPNQVRFYNPKQCKVLYKGDAIKIRYDINKGIGVSYQLDSNEILRVFQADTIQYLPLMKPNILGISNYKYKYYPHMTLYNNVRIYYKEKDENGKWRYNYKKIYVKIRLPKRYIRIIEYTK